MIIIARRIAGALLLFGLVYMYAHALFADDPSIPIDPNLLPVLTHTRFDLGALSLGVWSLSLAWTGVVLIQGKANPWVVNAVGLLAFIVGCMALLGTVPYMGNERIFWAFFQLNLIPIIQGMALCVLGKSHDPKPLPQAS